MAVKKSFVHRLEHFISTATRYFGFTDLSELFSNDKTSLFTPLKLGSIT